MEDLNLRERELAGSGHVFASGRAEDGGALQPGPGQLVLLLPLTAQRELSRFSCHISITEKAPRSQALSRNHTQIVCRGDSVKWERRSPHAHSP